MVRRSHISPDNSYSSNSSAIVVANTTAMFESEMEGPFTEAEAHIDTKKISTNAAVSAGRISVKKGDISVEANGPNASAMFMANDREAKVMVGAEIASASFSMGPVGMKAGFGVKTGARFGEDGAEVKPLGCGMSVGRTMGVSLFGSEVKIKLW